MSDIGDLFPVPKTVPFGRVTVEVVGLSLRKLSSLIAEYPDVTALFSGGKVGIPTLLKDAPDAVLGVFALSVGAENEDLVKAFDVLSFGQQADILGAIYDLTLEGERAAPFLVSLLTQLRVGENQPSPPESQSLSPSDSPSSQSS